MLTIDSEKPTLTESIYITGHTVRNAMTYYKDYVQELLDDAKYPDYHESYRKLIAYELSDSDVVEILERAKELYEDDESCCLQTYTDISDPDVVTDAIATWCDDEFSLEGTAL